MDFLTSLIPYAGLMWVVSAFLLLPITLVAWIITHFKKALAPETTKELPAFLRGEKNPYLRHKENVEEKLELEEEKVETEPVETYSHVFNEPSMGDLGMGKKVLPEPPKTIERKAVEVEAVPQKGKVAAKVEEKPKRLKMSEWEYTKEDDPAAIEVEVLENVLFEEDGVEVVKTVKQTKYVKKKGLTEEAELSELVG